MIQNEFNSYLIRNHFSVESPIINFGCYMMGSIDKNRLKDVSEKNEATYKTLKEKYNTKNPREAVKLEIKKREKKWQPSEEALAYIKELNDTYKGKKIKFYYTDSIYEELCESIELVDTETRKMPMIITKNKHYSLINMVDITILPAPPSPTEILHKLETVLSDNQFDSKNKDLIFRQCFNETWFSNMLAWLLDPKGSHGLGVKFTMEFLKTIAQTRTEGSEHDKYTRRKKFLKLGEAGAGTSPTGFSLKNASILREFYLTNAIGKSNVRGSRYCDVVLFDLDSSDSLFVVIENKLFTMNHPGQLESYYQAVEDKFERVKVLEYVYLTLHGSSPVRFKDDSDNQLKYWVSLSWTDDILSVLTRLYDNEKHSKKVLELKTLLEWLKNLRAKVSKEYIDDLRSLLLKATAECLLEELQRICSKGTWAFSREDGNSIIISHSSSSNKLMYIELLPNLSVTVQSRRGGGKELFEKIIVPYGINTDQIFNLLDITARDIYHLYFQCGNDYLADKRRCTQTISESKKIWKPVFDFLYHHHNELKILFKLSQYVWNAQKIDL